MKIAVQDANIFFDMIDGGFADLWFALGIETHTTDLVLSEIHEENQRASMDLYIRSGKLVIDSLNDLSPLVEMQSNAQDLSIQDCSILHLSEGLNAMLLTGDRNLRKFAGARSIEVHGTLWILDKLIEASLLEPLLAAKKLTCLLKMDRRLPQIECEQRVDKWSKFN